MSITTRHRSNYSFWLLNAAAYLTWLGILVAALPALNGTPNRTLVLVLFGLFFAGLSVYVFLEERPYLVHVYLLFQTAIAVAISMQVPERAASGISTFLFILSAQAMLFLPLIPGLVWILFFIGVTWLAGFFAFDVLHANDFVAILGGYLFFGTFGAGLRQANEARQRSQQLLTELQEAHEQLKAYTSQAQQLAVAEERNRLAREMHDALGHRLTVAVVQLEGAQRLIPSNPERSASMIEAMRAQLKQALTELRQTVSALRSPENSAGLNGSLATAVTHLAQTFQEATGLPVQLHLPETLPLLPEAHRIALYRAAQESLTNVQRHANAQQAWLELSANDTQVTLTVTDDGQGFQSEGADGRFGLIGLRERAKQLGGALTLGAAEQGGARLCMQLPIPHVEAADV
ncbi:MAG: sensor histidine kinase [Anaerolineales bacterium]|nr:sensor histidine kinase [Anaerolineales bacterium]MCB8936895.1 sensor histidine kinase [Ardenticatenaceae bacterium]